MYIPASNAAVVGKEIYFITHTPQSVFYLTIIQALTHIAYKGSTKYNNQV